MISYIIIMPIVLRCSSRTSASFLRKPHLGYVDQGDLLLASRFSEADFVTSKEYDLTQD
jgi:hypothetical protein